MRMIVIAAAMCLAAAPAVMMLAGPAAGGNYGECTSCGGHNDRSNTDGGHGGMSYEEALSAARRDALRFQESERVRRQREFMDAWRASVQTYEASRGGGDGHVAGSGDPRNGGYGRDSGNFGH